MLRAVDKRIGNAPRKQRKRRGRTRRSPGLESPLSPRDLLALFAAKDLDTLIDATFLVLGRAVVCDFVSVFYRRAGTGLVKERDSRGREYGPEFMRRYTELTPAIPIVMANRGIKMLATRTAMPLSDEKLRRTPFYKEVMRPQGWRHGVALCFWGEPTAEFPAFVASVYRTEGKRDFSQRDIDELGRAHSFLDCAVNRVLEREATETLQQGVAVAVRDRARGFAILDSELRLAQASAMARQLCADWLDDGKGGTPRSAQPWRLPSDLAAVCRELSDEWQTALRAHGDPGSLVRRMRRHLSHACVLGLTATITIVCPRNASLLEPTFVLEFERQTHGVALDTPARSARVLTQMTVAERRVAIVLADGLSNQEIADHLGKSVDAVKFLLHSIYRRTGIPNRASLVAALRPRSRA